MTLAKEILKGDRTALGQGITLLESTLPEHEEQARELLKTCLPYSGKSIRIGVTGVPGVGKSTFIEVFGELLTREKKKVAVLAIDPTSKQTKGSILGDKSRMHGLSTNENAFIRPSPSSGTLGGVANKTRESIILCEASGYNIILIETVGVGQNATTVNNLVDFFLLLMLAGAGDELQGIKRGIMELANGLIINKSDGNNITAAKNAALAYKRSLHLFPPMENGWIPQVSICSALENKGIDRIWNNIKNYDSQMNANGWKKKNRETQNIYWLHYAVKQELGKKQYKSLAANGKLQTLEKQLKRGKSIFQLLRSL